MNKQLSTNTWDTHKLFTFPNQLVTGMQQRLNLGCGYDKKPGWVNADYIAECNPDVCFDAGGEWPFADESFIEIYASHIFEHLDDWWVAFQEAARVLKLGGRLEIRVPDESTSMAGTYRDHKHIFTIHSFHGVQGFGSKTNAWALECENKIPLGMISYYQVPYREYRWYPKFILNWCGKHLRNFIHEQVFIFMKIGYAIPYSD